MAKSSCMSVDPCLYSDMEIALTLRIYKGCLL